MSGLTEQMVREAVRQMEAGELISEPETPCQGRMRYLRAGGSERRTDGILNFSADEMPEKI